MKVRQLLNFTAYARHRGVSVEAVSKAVEAERITVHQADKGRRLIDPVLADSEWDANSDAAKRIGAEAAAEAGKPAGVVIVAPSANNVTYMEHRAKREAANARLTEIRLAQTEGRLIPIEQVTEVAFNTARLVRQAILGIPDRLSGVLAGESDSHRVHIMLTEELNRALEALAGDDASGLG